MWNVRDVMCWLGRMTELYMYQSTMISTLLYAKDITFNSRCHASTEGNHGLHSIFAINNYLSCGRCDGSSRQKKSPKAPSLPPIPASRLIHLGLPRMTSTWAAYSRCLSLTNSILTQPVGRSARIDLRGAQL